MRPSSLLGTFVLLVAGTGAGAFEAAVSGPDFTVVVPNLPAIGLQTQTAVTPGVAPGVTQALVGADATYQVSLLVSVPQAAGPATTRACAGTFLRSLVAQPGMPDRDSIYRAPLDPDTFLVLYILGAEAWRLHAHLLSSVDASRCVEVHFSRALRDGEDEDDWRKSFLGAQIRAAHR